MQEESEKGMTALIKQRKPDKGALEKHVYINMNVEKAYTHLACDGCIYIKLEFKDGRGVHYTMQFFDMEKQAAGQRLPPS